MNKIRLFFIAVTTAAIMASCSDNEPNYDSTNREALNRKEFVSGKDFQDLKENFSRLHLNDKRNLWNNKIEQLLSLDLPTQHIILVKELKEEFAKNVEGMENNVQSTVIKLAQITPEKDFTKMFFELGDYEFSGKFETVGDNQLLISYLKSCDFKYNQAVKGGVASKEAPLPACNCNYTCTAQTINPGLCSNGKCAPTADGCGPFGMSECDGRLYFC